MESPVGTTYELRSHSLLLVGPRMTDKADSCGELLTTVFTCSTVVLQCYRRQVIPMEQAKIRPSVTLYSLDRSLPNLVLLITSATPSQRPILVKFG